MSACPCGEMDFSIDIKNYGFECEIVKTIKDCGNKESSKPELCQSSAKNDRIYKIVKIIVKIIIEKMFIYRLLEVIILRNITYNMTVMHE